MRSACLFRLLLPLSLDDGVYLTVGQCAENLMGMGTWQGLTETRDVP